MKMMTVLGPAVTIRDKAAAGVMAEIIELAVVTAEANQRPL